MKVKLNMEQHSRNNSRLFGTLGLCQSQVDLNSLLPQNSLFFCFFFSGFFSIEPVLWCASASSHLQQSSSSISLFKANDISEHHLFLFCHTRLPSLCSSPPPSKIYGRCPGGREFLPRQILSDRITTVSVPQQELMQDRMH